MSMSRLLFSSIAITVLFATAAVAEPVFTINVPVNFQAIRPEVQVISVSCRLFANDQVTNKTAPFGPQLKYKYVKPDPTTGNYSGTVQLVWDRSEFNSTEQKNFGTVHRVDCNFGLNINDTQYTPNFPGAGIQVRASPGHLLSVAFP